VSQGGSIRKRGDTWTAYWFVRGPDGQRVQRSKGGFRVKRDARTHLTTVLGSVQRGDFVESKRMTLSQFVREHFLPGLDLRPTTVASYADLLEGHVLPRLGGLQLAAITPNIVKALYDELLLSGRRSRIGGLSPRSVQYVGTVFGKVMSQAVAFGYVSRNPVSAVKRPTPRPPEMQAWTADEAAGFLDYVRDDRLYAAWVLFLTRGPRRGEIAGLRWSDVDLDGGRLSISHTRVSVGYEAQSSPPKTRQSRRTIPLDAQLVSILRSHRRRQLEDRLAWGKAWTDTGVVFTREDGVALHPEYFSQAFERLTRLAGLRTIRLHDTRHTAASLALQAGIPVKVVSEWLGHSSVSITLDVYSHVIPSMSEEAGARLTALVLKRGR